MGITNTPPTHQGSPPTPGEKFYLTIAEVVRQEGYEYAPAAVNGTWELLPVSSTLWQFNAGTLWVSYDSDLSGTQVTLFSDGWPMFVFTSTTPLVPTGPNLLPSPFQPWYGDGYFTCGQPSTDLQKVNYDMAFCPCPDALGEYLPGNVVRTVRPADNSNFKVKLA